MLRGNTYIKTFLFCAFERVELLYTSSSINFVIYLFIYFEVL